MVIDKNEKRRLILWSINRANQQVAPGPNERFPVQIDRISSSYYQVVSPAVLEILGRAIPSKRSLGFGFAVVFASIFFYSLFSPAAIARRAIGRVGGFSHERYTSRLVFQNKNLKPAEVMGLIPYLKNVPIARNFESMPMCVVLDFNATPMIDEKTAMVLVKNLEHTIVFYHSSHVARWSASDDLQQEMLLWANRNNRKK